MKKFLMLFIFAIAFPIAVFCQSITIDTSNLSGYFSDIGPMVAFVLFLIEFAKTKLKIKGGLLVVISWAISIILALIGYFLKFGMFAELTIISTILHGLGIAVAANLGADIPTIKAILTFLLSMFEKNKMKKI